ncbi:MAG: malonyl-ACP O-methyltransferase BioC [Planctomycetota bacterium]|jgi:malonyl-CoA O-methyltransferase
MTDKETIRKNFSRFAASYDTYSSIQDHAGARLIELTAPDNCAKILDIGCGTGNYTRLLRDKFPAAKIKALDISERMINIANRKLSGSGVEFIVADAEEINLTEGFDLITSNACLQWFGDLEAALKNYSNLLNAGGNISFSVFGPAAFRQLHLAITDLFKKKISISSNFFFSRDRVSEILEKYFDQTCIEEQLLDESYGSLRQLLNTIKYTGTRGLGLNGVFLGRWQLTELEKIYKDKFNDITATYQLFYFRAKKKEKKS